MKLCILSLLLALLAITVSAVAPQKAVIITYPNHTPDSVLRDAMNAIEEAGGIITHEYSECSTLKFDIDCAISLTTVLDLLKGFAAKASAKALETVTSLSAQEFPAYIEEDSIVSIDGDTIESGHVN